MPEEISITVYKFEELTGEAKDNARYKIGAWLQEDENVNLSHMFREYLEERGLPTDKLEWSLGHSQGDGVAFYGDINVEAALRFMKRLSAHRTILKHAPYARIDRNSWGTHYSHYNTMDVIAGYEWEWTEQRSLKVDALREELEEFVRNVSRELEKIGYEAFEWATEDEQIIDHCDANDYRFDERGNLV